MAGSCTKPKTSGIMVVSLLVIKDAVRGFSWYLAKRKYSKSSISLYKASNCLSDLLITSLLASFSSKTI